MPTDAEQLATIKSNYLAELATESASPKPSYSIQGRQVSWNEYRTHLLDNILKIDGLLSTAQGPIEVHSQGIA